MSDKSHDAEPELAGGSDAAEAVESELVEDDSLSIEDIEDPEALAAAEEAVLKDSEAHASEPSVDGELLADDVVIAELEEGFTDEEREAAAGAPILRKTVKAPVKKGAATRKRGQAAAEHEDPYRASNPAQFAQQSAGELKKVVWPTWPETAKTFTAVLIFVLIMIAIVGGLDLFFGWGLLQLFGSK